MTTIELAPSDVQLLRTVLQSKLARLAVEIEHTDSREFRTILKTQQGSLERVLGKLPPPPPMAR